MYVFTTARVHVLTPSKGMLAGSERFGLIGETILKRQMALFGLWTAETSLVCMIAEWNYGICLAKRYVASNLLASAPS